MKFVRGLMAIFAFALVTLGVIVIVADSGQTDGWVVGIAAIFLAGIPALIYKMLK